MPVTPAAFNQAMSRHSANLEPRRQSRRDEFFRDELLDDCGEVVIGQSRFHPADVLEKMKPGEHEDARIESKRRFYDKLAQTVCDMFPSPIARPFDAFVNGSRDPLRRLFHMRDTWEGDVAVLHGILLAECADKAVDLACVLVRRDNISNPTPLQRRDLLDWSISARLGLIEGILIHAEHEDLGLDCSSVIPIDVVSAMR